MPSYTYSSAQASNGITIHAIKTSPNNLRPILLNPNVNMKDSGYYGVNGGFFAYTDTLYSIAVVNDVPISKGGSKTAAGSGYENTSYKRGTIVWDPNAGFSVQVVSSAASLTVNTRSNFWAQGGISMYLGDSQSSFNTKVAPELSAAVDANSARARTAIVYGTNAQCWLVTTFNGATLSAFRAAILEKLAGGHINSGGVLIDGVFLDGGSSTEMRCTEITQDADSTRTLVTIIGLLSK